MFRARIVELLLLERQLAHACAKRIKRRRRRARQRGDLAVQRFERRQHGPRGRVVRKSERGRGREAEHALNERQPGVEGAGNFGQRLERRGRRRRRRDRGCCCSRGRYCLTCYGCSRNGCLRAKKWRGIRRSFFILFRLTDGQGLGASARPKKRKKGSCDSSRSNGLLP